MAVKFFWSLSRPCVSHQKPDTAGGFDIKKTGGLDVHPFVHMEKSWEIHSSTFDPSLSEHRLPHSMPWFTIIVPVWRATNRGPSTSSPIVTHTPIEIPLSQYIRTAVWAVHPKIPQRNDWLWWNPWGIPIISPRGLVCKHPPCVFMCVQKVLWLIRFQKSCFETWYSPFCTAMFSWKTHPLMWQIQSWTISTRNGLYRIWTLQISGLWHILYHIINHCARQDGTSSECHFFNMMAYE